MATSSKKDVFVYVPKRQQNRVNKRFSKRQTTVRAFTFVKDWQSPAVPSGSDTIQPNSSIRRSKRKQQKKRGGYDKEDAPVLSLTSAVSSSSSTPPLSVVDHTDGFTSPASLSRISPSPRLLPKASPRARAVANSSQNKGQSTALSSSSPAPHSSTSSGQSSQSQLTDGSSSSGPGSGPVTSHFRTPLSPPQRVSQSQSSTRTKSSAHSKSSTRSKSSINSKSSTKSGKQSSRSSGQVLDAEDSFVAASSNRTNNSSKNQSNHSLRSSAADNRSISNDDQQLEDTVDGQADRGDSRGDQEDDHFESNTGDSQGDKENIDQSESDHGGLLADSDQSETHNSDVDDDVAIDQDDIDQQERGTVVQQSLPSQRPFRTPADKSTSIIHRTPVSGPANRIAAKRRKASPIPKNGGSKQLPKKPRSKPPATGSKAKVRLWIGSGRRRKATDTTDLDIILSKIESVSLEYRENLASKAQRKAISNFYQYLEKDFTDKIDLAQEQKELKSSLSRMNITTRKQRKELLTLQQRNARLDIEIAQMKTQASKTQESTKALQNISTFLTDLQHLQKKYTDTKPHDDDTESQRVTTKSVDAQLNEVKAVSRSRYQLRTMNNRLQDWLDAH